MNKAVKASVQEILIRLHDYDKNTNPEYHKHVQDQSLTVSGHQKIINPVLIILYECDEHKITVFNSLR